MRFGVPLHGNRVAPRSAYAESLLVVTMHAGHVISRRIETMRGDGGLSLVGVINDLRIDILVCGGISRSLRNALLSNGVEVVENITGTVDEILEEILRGNLLPPQSVRPEMISAASAAEHRVITLPGMTGASPEIPGVLGPRRLDTIDCINCRDRVCLRGEDCIALEDRPAVDDREFLAMIDSSLDISAESERQLCRLTELVYYCLDMNYREIGIAFCMDLIEPAEILTGLLRRFFDVHPVCCKIGGKRESDALGDGAAAQGRARIICNPVLQAETLNRIGTEFNVIVGLCIGMDSIFTQLSRAPVTTLFVKDKSLANNPIGAVYSDYYLKEAAASLATAR